MKVNFFWTAKDADLEFAVIIARYNGKWVFAKSGSRDSYGCPKGHREPGENIETTAKRGLRKETGAVIFSIIPVCVCSLDDGNKESFGMLYYADIDKFGKPTLHETADVLITDGIPEKWTYPDIQPLLFDKVRRVLDLN